MPVQEQVLTNAFSGQDLYVQSQTGTGKTAAFLVVIFQRLLTEALLNGKKAIIMVPTRELAVQVEDEAKLLGKYLSFKIGSFYGGVGYTEQQLLLRDNVQILVGTPGRVLDLNSSGKMNLMDIAFLILDEADRMFDMGFYPDLRKLIKVVPPVDRRQTMLFSATLNNRVKNLAWEYTKNPLEIEIAPENVTVEEIDQLLYHVPSDDKMKLLLGILAREKPESAIIFCNTKRYAEIVAKRLRINGIECEFIMGDLPQSKRLRIIEDVKAGKINYLVATDVAARGLDIESLAMVVNYDLPVETENYVHRIGRTARAGKTGKAITLASEQDVYELPAIEKYIGKKIPSAIAEPALYTEDKSQGMRIRTDFFSLRRDGGDGERRRRDEGTRNLTGRGRKGGTGGENWLRGREPRYREKPEQERRRTLEKRSEGASARNVQGSFEDETRRNSRDAGGSSTGNLSRLSLEERMAYYKRKYDSSQTGDSHDGSSGKPRGTPPAPSKAGERQKEPGNRPRSGGNSRGRRRVKAESGEFAREPAVKVPEKTSRASPPRVSRDLKKTQRRQVGGKQPTKSGTAGAVVRVPENTPPRRGLMQKLLGFFKKKPRD
jgi:ATP-dependent RNA helicase RhlB